MHILNYIKYNQQKAIFLSKELKLVSTRDEKWIKLYNIMLETIQKYKKALAFLFRVIKTLKNDCLDYQASVQTNNLIASAIRNILFPSKIDLKNLNRLSFSVLNNLLQLHFKCTNKDIVPFIEQQISESNLEKLGKKFL